MHHCLQFLIKKAISIKPKQKIVLTMNQNMMPSINYGTISIQNDD